MKIPLKIGIEKAFASAYLPTVLPVDELQILEGHEKDPDRMNPNLIVYAEDAIPHPEMPTETGVKIVRLRFKFTLDSVIGDTGADADRSPLDEWRELLEAGMLDTESILAMLNAPADGEDERENKTIHIYDVLNTQEPDITEGTDWVEDNIFDVVCQTIREIKPPRGFVFARQPDSNLILRPDGAPILIPVS